MGLFKKNKKVGLISDIIRCDEPSYLIWKWHPDGTQPGQHGREYAIRSGSRLRVKDGEVAVFVYPQKKGDNQEFIVGPFDEKLKTANLPILTSIIGAFFGGDTPFQAEVYFINLAGIIQTKFAVPYFDVGDYRFTDYTVPVAVRGSITFKISDYRNFIKLHRLTNFDLETFTEQIADAVSRYVKGKVASASADFNIPVLKIESKITDINDAVELNIKNRLRETFGVEVSGFDIETIEIDKSSNDYVQLKKQQEEITRTNLDDYKENLRIQREENQYAMHKQTQTQNIGAFQIEKQVEVGIAGAEALGKMGANGAGTVNLGNTGAGFNPASMMASIAVGSVVGRNIADTMNNAMAGTNNLQQVPPPIPKTVYNVVKDGKSIGPFEIDKIIQLINSNEISPDTLIWKQGMPNWAKANTVEDLKDFFPPPIE